MMRAFKEAKKGIVGEMEKLSPVKSQIEAKRGTSKPKDNDGF